MSRPLWLGLAAALALGLSSCDSGLLGGRAGSLVVTVAPLSLTGLVDADYTLTVTNGTGGSGDVVWSRPVTTQQHGDGAGSLSYVGTCDASTGVNTVQLTLTALYDASGPVPTETYMNPTPIEQEVACVEGADTAVTFDLTVARRAQQGFFDVAIQFSDVFCSAKFDCCRPSVGTSCAGDGSDDILLLATPSGARGRTMVLGFACTVGTEGTAATALQLDDLALDCDVGSDDTTFVADVTVDPTRPDLGNQCTAAAGAMSACPAVAEFSGADADTYLFQVAVYRGDELLTTAAGPAHKTYWNVALGVTPDIASCTLRSRGTAYDAGSSLVEGDAYPYIVWDVDLGTCAAEALSFDTPDASLTSAYGPFAFATLFSAPAISFAPGTVFCDVGQACTVAAPGNDGGAVAAYSVTPALPGALGLDAVTGLISGTPGTPSAASDYDVTATSPGGSSTATLSLAVRDAPPTALTYAPTSLNCTQNQPCSLAAPTSSGGAVVSYAIAPALPVGLTLTPGTGAISGTPTVAVATATYTVTASNTGGSATASLSITVTSAVPTGSNLIPGNTTYVVARNGVQATCTQWQGQLCTQPKLRPQNLPCGSYPYANQWHAIHYNGNFFCYYATGNSTVVASGTATWQGPPTVHAAWSGATCSAAASNQLHGFSAGQMFPGGTALAWDYGRGAIGSVAAQCNW